MILAQIKRAGIVFCQSDADTVIVRSSSTALEQSSRDIMITGDDVGLVLLIALALPDKSTLFVKPEDANTSLIEEKSVQDRSPPKQGVKRVNEDLLPTKAT
ncbi:hypothetical protein AVEN_257187-1 [Araneus ventricosus]|uniref:Uncharacterized protein n=1 Tax=Araneus ventricosus TaxID=182803 RepID=A0A4Y2F586_ARAVE|nr:hypothetical protein AVEN_257187-1 [Araneus ventricosus]